MREQNNTNLLHHPSLFRFRWKRGGHKRCCVTLWPSFPPAEGNGSLNHKMKWVRVGWRTKQIKHSHSPCRYSSMPSITITGARREVPAAWERRSGWEIASAPHQTMTRWVLAELQCTLMINIDKGEEEWGVPRSSGGRNQPRNCTRHPVEHHEVSYGWDTMQTTQNTYLPLVSRARYCQYRPGGGVVRRWRQGGKRSEGGRCYGWASPPGGEEATLRGLPPRGRGTITASWMVGFLVLMACDRDSGGGRMAAAVLPILRHGARSEVAVGDFWKICIMKGTVSNLAVLKKWITEIKYFEDWSTYNWVMDCDCHRNKVFWGLIYL
jgi:hypothetical protein